MARVTIATDDFNRAALGANWEQVNPGAATVQIVTSTAFAGSVFGQQGVARWVGAGSFTDDQGSSVTIQGTPTGSNNYGIGVVARASGDLDAARDYYYGLVSDTTYLGKVVNGTLTVLATGSVSWAGGDRLEIECEGTEIRLCQNGTALGGIWTVTDSDLTTGLPGIIGLGDPGICTGDDWIGFIFAAADTLMGQACL